MMTTSTTTRRRWRRRKHRNGLLLLAIPLLSSFIYLFSVDFNFYLNQIIVTNNNENAITNVEYEYDDNAAEFSSSLRNDATKILSLQSPSNSTLFLGKHPNNKSSYNNNNTTTFVPLQNMPKGYGEIYSGMWYQSISTMLQLNFTHAHTLEMISFLSFVSDEKRNHTTRRPLMTTDWFDFSVEHLSKYVKHYFEEEEEEESVVVVQRRVGELIRGYIDKSLEKKRMEMMEQQWWWYDDSLSTVVKNGTTATTAAAARKNDTQPNLSSAAAAEAAAAVRHTIAIIPIRIEETNHHNTSSSSNPQQQHDDIDHYEEYNQHHLSILQLTATITSLWKHHFPRIVIAGVSSSERQAFQSMLQIFQQQQHYFKVLPMELVYVHMEGHKKEWRNVPKMAMLEFQRAVRESKRQQLLEEDNVVGSTKDGRDKRNETIITSSSTAERNNNNNNNSSDNNFVTSWLGTNPQQWQHIYFSEPDLLLQTRSTALPSIIREINKGHVLTAHRLQPIPHMRQFADVIDAAIVQQQQQHQQQQEQSSTTTNHHHDVVSLVRYMNRNTLPDHGPFEQIQVLNPHTTSCCDRGNFFPANVENSKEPIQARKQFGCPGTFELCGFRKYKEFQRQRRGVGSGSGIGGGGSEEEEEEDSSNHHWKDILEAHKLLIPYNLIALGEGYGTGIPLVHAHQRVCKVQQEVCL